MAMRGTVMVRRRTPDGDAATAVVEPIPLGPSAFPRGAGRRLPHHVPVAQARRQGNPAQAPEPGLLSDQRRGPRGLGRGRGAAPASRATTGFTPTIAIGRFACNSGMTPLDMLLEAVGAKDDPQSRRAPDALALGLQAAAHRLPVEPHRHADSAGRGRRRSQSVLRTRPRGGGAGLELPSRTKWSTSRSATAPRARASSGSR